MKDKRYPDSYREGKDKRWKIIPIWERLLLSVGKQGCVNWD
jgi:hypothetical protein